MNASARICKDMIGDAVRFGLLRDELKLIALSFSQINISQSSKSFTNWRWANHVRSDTIYF